MKSYRLPGALLLSLALGSAFAAPVQRDHVEAELVAEHLGLVAGEYQNTVALRLKPEPDWHVYWLNPGDSGIATSLKWTLPEGVEAGPIQWPRPHAYTLGDLTNYGYGEETLHLVDVRVPASWPVEKPLPLRVEAKWLVCKDVCIPGSASLALDLPVVPAPPAADARWAKAFASARADLPRAAPDWDAQFQVRDGEFSLRVEGAGFIADKVEFFAEPNDLVNHAAPQRVALDGSNGLRLTQAQSSYFVEAPAQLRGVLVLHEGRKARAFQIEARQGSVEPVAASAITATAPLPTPIETAATPGLLLVLLSALLGGLILNLMPCVFPVLSLKALSILQSRGQDAGQNRRHALAYTVGVVASFVLVAAVLLGLRASGQAIGWGFQLQSPLFVGLLAYLLFALGLSLSGFVDFGTRWMGAGQALTQREGLSGSFFTGVLAVVVASPCTVPFMGTALGYAVTQPAPLALVVFATLGLGLALPFLLIGFFPRLAAFLPRPGAWMETFKQAMAFPLYLTVVWLVWVLARQTDVNVAALVLVGLVLVSFALWLWPRDSLGARALKIAALLAAAVLLMALQKKPEAGAASVAPPAMGEVWSEERVAQLRAEGRTIFVDFTADWCLTCKVNERVALHNERVLQAFGERKVAYLVADWTRNDPAITQALARFNRPGVPLYLVYVNGGEPKLLPQILTPDLVIDALN